MRVIGVGFGRSGTMSLKHALEEVGAGPCFHMIDLIRDPDNVDPWHDAAVRGEKDWDAMFSGYDSTIDWPGCTFWEELIEVYPDAPQRRVVPRADRQCTGRSALGTTPT